MQDAAHDTEMQRWFAPGGGLSQAIPNFHARAAQRDMAQAIFAAIENNDTLIVEAGTGTGKTYAYLVPALLHGGKVIISTGTKNLQDQLFARDLPTIRKALAVPVSVALLKGRANYVCHYHLERAQDTGLFAARQDIVALRAIVQFSKLSQTGDKADLAEVPENSPVWSKVTSTRDNCLGSDCPSYQKCFVMQARRSAQQADVVVVNHHLFFADLLLKDTGMADLLPNANTIIFDEAHQLPEIATLFFGETLSTSQLLELCRDTVVEGLAQARDAYPWAELAAQLEYAARDCRLSLGEANQKVAAIQLPTDSPFFASIVKIKKSLSDLTQALVQQAQRSEGLQNCAQRGQDLLGKLAGWSDKIEVSDASGTVFWVETYTSTVQLHRTPLSVAPIFGRQLEGPPRSWIFTSATLAVKDKFHHYADQLGLDATKSLALPSPFDYAQQALLYVPTHLPLPSHPGHLDALVEAALPLLRANTGGAFFLCTTLRAVTRIADRLRQMMSEYDWDIPLLVQGEASRNALLERFRTLGNAILVGSQSFWEGVDVRGEALSLVIIDKLPFAPPDDPVLAARLNAIEQSGQSPFAVYQIPQAAIALKQGAGRLIRSETDRGLLMIGDIRLVEQPYGRQIWQSLPPFARTKAHAEALAFLRAGADKESLV